MKVFSTIKEIKEWRQGFKNEAKTVGFVPTMGALHRGHLALAERAKKENKIVVASIFVNRLQFNDPQDFEKYPRTLKTDIEMLAKTGCDAVFSPSADEMYPNTSIHGKENSSLTDFHLGMLDRVMEGKHRPGHFKGVCVVVKKLFDIVEPSKAYFGEKDFQQLAVIKYMVKTLGLPVQIIPCPTVRETDGLAMSSRNVLLRPEERKEAPVIFKVLSEAKAAIQAEAGAKGEDSVSAKKIQEDVRNKINNSRSLVLEYIEIVNAETLQPVQQIKKGENLRACIAVKAGSVRLIDNIAL